MLRRLLLLATAALLHAAEPAALGEEGPDASAPDATQPVPEAAPTVSTDRLLLLRHLTEAAEEGARRRHGPLPALSVPPDGQDLAAQLATATALHRRLYVARAGWHGGAAAATAAAGAAWLEPFLTADSAPAQRCAADLLLERLTDTAAALVDPRGLDHPPVQSVVSAVDAATDADLMARNDGVAVLPPATAGTTRWLALPTWQTLGPCTDGLPVVAAIEVPPCLPSPLPHRSAGPVWQWQVRAAEQGRVAFTANGTVHAVAEFETTIEEVRWLRLAVSGPAALWLDGQPAWSTASGTAVALRIRLHRGRHQLRLLAQGAPSFAAAFGSAPVAVDALSDPAAAAALVSRIPTRWALTVPDPEPLVEMPTAIPHWPLRWRSAPPRVLFAVLPGPAPDEAARWRPELDGAVPGSDMRWGLIDPAAVRHRRLPGINGLYAQVAAADLTHLAPGRLLPASGGTLAIAVVLDNDRLRHVKFDTKGAQLRLWLGGLALAGDAVLRLRPGRHLLLATSTVGRIPPSLRERVYLVLAVDQLAGALNAGHAQWLDAVAPLEAGLQQVVRALPGTSEAAAAAAALQELAATRIDRHG